MYISCSKDLSKSLSFKSGPVAGLGLSFLVKIKKYEVSFDVNVSEREKHTEVGHTKCVHQMSTQCTNYFSSVVIHLLNESPLNNRIFETNTSRLILYPTSSVPKQMQLQIKVLLTSFFEIRFE